MPDIDDELRGLLHRKAEEVPSHREVPRPMVTRARRRIALNAMGVGLGLVLVASGAFAGVRSLGPSIPRPAGSTPPTSRPVPPTPSASGTPSCPAAQLTAVASLGAAAGSREGDIIVTNGSAQACTLRGTPTVTLLDTNLTPVSTDISFGSSQPNWAVNGSPKPSGWPVVTLRPGERASFRVRWGNWCSATVAQPVWQIEIAGGETLGVGGFDGSMVPPCNGQTQPSTIEVGPVEPRAGP